MNERRLHIGGGVRVPGWEVLDVRPGPHVDHVGDAADLSRFADNTFAVVYASHVLEHFDYQEELLLVLKEWRRVLVPGGRLLVSVPDLDVCARLLLMKERLDASQRFQVMRMLFGGHTHAYDYHLVGLNEEFLKGYLEGVGFVQVRRVEGFGLFDDTSSLAVDGIRISLNMEAVKP